jgi:hypothetical protein
MKAWTLQQILVTGFDVACAITCGILAYRTRHSGRDQLEIIIGPIIKPKECMDKIKMEVGDRLYASIAPKSKKGVAVSVDGNPTFAVGDADVVKVTPPDATGKAILKALAVGTAILTIDADADLGPGTDNIERQFEIDVVEPESDTFDLVTADVPDDVPDPTAAAADASAGTAAADATTEGGASN